MKDNLDIIFHIFDENNFVVVVKRGTNNVFLDLGLCSFEEEMEYWDMPTKLVDYKGEEAFLFANNINKEELKAEIARFTKANNI